MSYKVSPIPAGYNSLTPYFIVKDAAKAIAFYKEAFNAIEVTRAEHGGKVCHAEITIGDSKLMLADEFLEMGCKSPQAFGGTPVSLCLYVEDVDSVVAKAVAAGATITQPLENKFYGDRNAMLEDPFGHKWCVATHIEDVSEEEVKARMAKLF
jgi:PhnB protein